MVVMYGKKGCDRCDRAKEKLVRMGVAYEYVDATEMMEPHDGWRDNESVELLAAYYLYYSLPLFRFDDEPIVDYSAAMAKCKRLAREGAKRATEAPQEIALVA